MQCINITDTAIITVKSTDYRNVMQCNVIKYISDNKITLCESKKKKKRNVTVGDCVRSLPTALSECKQIMQLICIY